MGKKLQSRKFWFALVGAMLPVVAQFMSTEIDMSTAIQLSVGILSAYIFGQGFVDGMAKKANPEQ